MVQKAKILGKWGSEVKVECPNCKESVYVTRGINKWAEWFNGTCWQCGWEFMLKDTQCDFLQPDSPFFEMYYKFHPEKDADKKRREGVWEEQKRKEGLEEKYDEMAKSHHPKEPGKIKPWQKKTLKREVLRED